MNGSRTTFVICTFGSSSTDTQGWHDKINKKMLHIDGTARESQSVLRRELLQYWSTEFGDQHVLGVSYAISTFNGADAESEAMHILGVSKMMWIVVVA